MGAKMEEAIEEGCDENGQELFGISIEIGSTIVGGLLIVEENEIQKVRTAFDIEQFIHFKEQKSHEHYRIQICSIAPGKTIPFHVLG